MYFLNYVRDSNTTKILHNQILVVRLTFIVA